MVTLTVKLLARGSPTRTARVAICPGNRPYPEFTKTTLIGGVLIILPVYLAALLLAKTVKGMLALLSPVTAQIPAAVEFRQVLASALLVAVCFIVGLIVRNRSGLAGIA